MLILNYYFVDVDENSCMIAEKKLEIDLGQVLKSKNKALLILTREYITRTVRRIVPWMEGEEFKLVFVNKQDKISVEADVADSETHKVKEGPIASTKKHEIFFVSPEQELNIACQVLPMETEIVSMRYDKITTDCDKLLRK